MTDNKQINHINISGANVYLSLSFGIIKLDTKEGKILDTYKLGFNVNYSYIEDNCLYAASKEAGLYKGKLTGNLLNSKEWTKIGSYKQLSENKKLVYDKGTGFWWTTTKEGKLTYYTVDSNNEPVYKTEGILPKGLLLTISTIFSFTTENSMLLVVSMHKRMMEVTQEKFMYGMEKTGLNLNNHLMMFLVIAT